jgi:hypothetical protein
MTEIDDLASFLAQAQPLPVPDAEQKRLMRIEQQAMLEHIGRVQFLAPLLCTCPLFSYDRWDSSPPQVACPIHSTLMKHPFTGAVMYPGIPGTLDGWMR